MDGTLAAIFLILGLGDMAINDCPTGCLAQSSKQPTWNAQAATVIFNEDHIGQELYIGYDSGQSYGPFAMTYGGSVTSDRDMWVGAGAKWTSERQFNGPVYFEASLMPGVYARGNGPDIGGALQFRSAVGLGYTFDNGSRLALLYDHRSNADTQDVNPGLETFSIRYTFGLQ